MRRQRHVVTSCTILILCAVAALCSAEQSATPTGQLLIEGDAVEKLILIDGGGNRIKATPVEKALELNVGTYTVNEIRLTGNLICRVNKPITVEVKPDAPAVLKVGAPLTPKIDVTRSGGLLVMALAIEGIGGCRYTGGPQAIEPPTFTVYSGDKEIAHEAFEYG